MNEIYLEGHVKERYANGQFIFLTLDKDYKEVEVACELINYSNNYYTILANYNYLSLKGSIKRNSSFSNIIYITEINQISREKYEREYLEHHNDRYKS